MKDRKMTKEKAKIIIGNIPINPENMDDCYTLSEYQEAKAMAIEALSIEFSEDAVSRQSVLSAICGNYPYLVMGICKNSESEKCIDLAKIRNLPSVPSARPRGHWVQHDTYFETDSNGMEDWGNLYKCSICGADEIKTKYEFCPRCGAKMVEEQNLCDTNPFNDNRFGG